MQTKRSAVSATIFFARQRAAATLDHVALPVDLVGPVDVDRDALDAIAVPHPMPSARRRRLLSSLLDTAPAMRS